MKFKLIEIGTADGRSREVPLGGEEFLIGRGEDCELCLRDPEVSRHHCLIRLRGAEVNVSDLGSINGTLVNEHRVLSQVKLATGDELRVAQFRFIVDLGDQPDFQVPQEKSFDALAATRTAKQMREPLDKKAV